MDRKRKNWAPEAPGKVNESNDDALDINSLPNEIILEVFGYLKQNQLGQIARVCRRWNVLTKSPILWKKVDIEFSSSHESQTNIAKSFMNLLPPCVSRFLWKNLNVKISPSHGCQTTVAVFFVNGLPSCVTTIRFNFMEYRNWIEPLDFALLCLRLEEKCPHLEELILNNARFSNSLPAVLGCTHFLQDVQKIIFESSWFLSIGECFGMSKVEILELYDCYFYPHNGSPFSNLPRLIQLHLHGTFVPNSWFEDDASFLNQLHVLNVGHNIIHSRIFSTIRNNGHNLRELYCMGYLKDHDLNFNNSAFPHLKAICLRHSSVTCEGVVSLIQSCPSLENVYVSECVAGIFSAHPFVVANRCRLGIVKAIRLHHEHNVYYSHT